MLRPPTKKERQEFFKPDCSYAISSSAIRAKQMDKINKYKAKLEAAALRNKNKVVVEEV